MNVLSLDIGGSKLICGAVTDTGQILAAEKFPLPAKYGAETISEIIRSIAPEICRRYKCAAAGIAIPGLADAEHGIWLYAPYSGIADFAVAGLVSSVCDIPAFADNDVNVCAVGESVFGVCRDTRNFIWITVSNGIGGAVFADGKLYTGSSENAGEFGHIKVSGDGRHCGCGAFGCLEAEAAGPAISDKYFDMTGDRADAKQIASIARSGVAAAVTVYLEAGKLIGRALAAAVNVLNPSAAVFGGGVSMDFDLLLPGIQESMKTDLFTAANRNLRICRTGLGYNASLLGAAALTLKNINKI